MPNENPNKNEVIKKTVDLLDTKKDNELNEQKIEQETQKLIKILIDYRFGTKEQQEAFSDAISKVATDEQISPKIIYAWLLEEEEEEEEEEKNKPAEDKLSAEIAIDKLIKEAQYLKKNDFNIDATGKIIYQGDLVSMDSPGFTTLPNDLKVEGKLILYSSNLTSLPDNLSVGGDLLLKKCNGLKTLPDNLTVGGDLSLQECNGLKTLPDNLTVQKGLDLYGCTGLTTLPNNLKVPENLILTGCTGLTTLPNNLKVRGNLILTGCTGLTTLPNNLLVEGDLLLSGGNKAELVKLKSTGKIKGNIYVNHQKVSAEKGEKLEGKLFLADDLPDGAKSEIKENNILTLENGEEKTIEGSGRKYKNQNGKIYYNSKPAKKNTWGRIDEINTCFIEFNNKFLRLEERNIGPFISFFTIRKQGEAPVLDDEGHERYKDKKGWYNFSDGNIFLKIIDGEIIFKKTEIPE